MKLLYMLPCIDWSYNEAIVFQWWLLCQTQPTQYFIQEQQLTYLKQATYLFDIYLNASLNNHVPCTWHVVWQKLFLASAGTTGQYAWAILKNPRNGVKHLFLKKKIYFECIKTIAFWYHSLIFHLLVMHFWTCSGCGTYTGMQHHRKKVS